MNTTTRTTCPYCGVGCGILASVEPDGSVTIAGDPDHPANFGRLCSKGAALGETTGLEERLLHPMIGGRRVAWEAALDAVAEGFLDVIERHGPDAVAFYVSGQLLTEDYYVANKLMKGFVGSANIDTNSRLCMSSAVAGHKRAFGADLVACDYADLEHADLVVLTGSNTAWCHPVLFRRLAKARRARPQLKVVVIDPRRTPTCDIADLHLPLRPGSDALLFNGLLAQLADQGKQHRGFTDAHTEGLDAALAAARASAPSVAEVAAGCGLSESDLTHFYTLFAGTERVLTLFSQGINQSASGTDKVNAIINCHLLTGRIGHPGCGPFSLTGQPNAMGGREVGGLSNQLAAHMELDDPHHRDRVQRFWGSPGIAERPGLKAVDLFRAVEAGRIKALWVMATNPAVSLPDAAQVRRALKNCELLVVSDCVAETDTSRRAHIRLPALTWGERDGTVTNSERRISRQRPFLPAPGEARADWWIVSEVAKRLGHGAHFAYPDAAAIFREHARLSAFENAGTRDFDLGGLAALDAPAYHALEPVQWPLPAGRPATRPFADGRFYTPSGRARFVAVTPRAPAGACDGDHPLLLNTGRTRDQWHTMTRTGQSPRLGAHAPEPYLEVHPQDAARLELRDGALARVANPRGEWLGRVRVSDGQRPGSLFAPMHWNECFAARAGVGRLIAPHTDPHSGQPQLKQTPVRVEPVATAWQGFLITRAPLPEAPRTAYWSRTRTAGGWRYELAGSDLPQAWSRFARDLLGERPGEWTEFRDPAQGRYRAARVADGRIDACLFIGPGVDLATRDWVAGLFAQEAIGGEERALLLAGRPPSGRTGEGRPVCACFGVGLATLERSVREHRLTSVEEVGRLLRAGTGCGSCIPEIRAVVRAATEPKADCA